MDNEDEANIDEDIVDAVDIDVTEDCAKDEDTADCCALVNVELERVCVGPLAP